MGPLFLLGALLAVAGASYVAMGAADPPSYPAAMPDGERYEIRDALADGPEELARVVGQIQRSWGIFESFFGLAVMILAAGPYRRGERWAWLVLWLLPVALVAELVNVLAAGMRAGPVFVLPLVAIAGLLLPVRRFLPARPAASS